MCEIPRIIENDILYMHTTHKNTHMCICVDVFTFDKPIVIYVLHYCLNSI